MLACPNPTPGKLIIPIIVDWPEGSKNGRDFRFPLDLEEQITDWKLFQ